MVIDIVLNEQAYRRLVRGEMLRSSFRIFGIKVCTFNIILSSAVNFRIMYDAVNRAEDNKEDMYSSNEKTI